MRRGWRRVAAGWVGLALAASAAHLGWRLQLAPRLDAELDRLEEWRPPTTVRVLGADDRVLDRFSLVRRTWVPIDELSPVLIDAVVAAEDRRYYDHAGVDLLGIARAAISNLEAGGFREGGSTITQQVVKNTLTGSERTLRRKAWEALLALRLERRMDKRRILELYLNLIYLGSGNHGVEAAAQDFFGHSARSVDLAEAALLAALIPSPSRFTPRSHPERAAERRSLVLDAMVEEAMVSPPEAAAAAFMPIAPPPRGPRRPEGAEGFLTEVRRQIRNLLGDRIPFRAGLRVRTTVDLDVQAAAEAAVREAVEAVEARHGRRRVDPAHPPPGCRLATFRSPDRLQLGLTKRRLEPAQLDLPVFDPDDPRHTRPLGRTLQDGDALVVCPGEGGRLDPAFTSEVEGAAVVMEHATGRVRALVGGRNMPMEGFNRATQALRQAGSAFKPFVYATALHRGASQLDLVLDGPLSLDAGGHRLWVPQNASRGFWGQVTLRTAFTYSLNTPAVRLAMVHGAAEIIGLARAAGITSPLRRDLTLALGTSEVRPIELAGALAGLVRGGVSVEPHLIESLHDASGRRMAGPGERIDWPKVDAALPGGPGARFTSAADAWQVVEMMRSVVTRGTGRAAHDPERDRGGKTGTTSDYRDAWFVGFDGAYVIAVWIGQDDGIPLGPGESGDRAALPAWRAIADALPATRGPAAPPEVVPIRVGRAWIDIAADAEDGGRAAVTLPGPFEPLPAAPAPPTVCDR